MEPRVGPDTHRDRNRVRVPMTARPVDEPHRTATQLELLFDLTFVVAVAAAVAQLGHGLAAGHAAAVVGPFLMVFFAIWWAWMNFTWFASSYDTDDVPYRLLTLLQMGGVLVLAAGVPAAFAGDYAAVTAGYLIMRVGLGSLWLRAAREDPTGRPTTLRYATGVAAVEIGWLVRLLLDELGLLPGAAPTAVFLALVAAELVVPVWAERGRGTTWHPQHIAERYSLFTIILLGESVLAVSTGIADVLGSGPHGPLVVVAGSGLVLLFALWWLYALEPSADGLSTRRGRSFLWGYGHYGVFAALAALGAGLEVAVRQADTHAATGPGYAVAVPVAAFLVLLWASHSPVVPRSRVRGSTLFGAAALVLFAPVAGAGAGAAGVVGLVALVAAAAVVVTVAGTARGEAPDPSRR
jgi:low temperature requirement protein LtrA